MFEQWKNVVDFNGYYQVSNLGNFRKHPDKQGKRKNPKPLARVKSVNRDGYEYVDLCKNGTKQRKTVHQLVAAAFIPQFIYGTEINHNDGNKRNNAIINLEISTPIHNNTHAHATGLIPKPGKSQYYNVSIQVDKRQQPPRISYLAAVKLNNQRNYIGAFASEIEAAQAVDNFLDSIKDTVRKRNFS
jgi:hypothetical protein